MHVPGTSQVGSTAYELQEIYGIEGQAADGAGGSEDDFDDGDEKTRSECVISITDPHPLHPSHTLIPPYTPSRPLTPPHAHLHTLRPLTHPYTPYTPFTRCVICMTDPRDTTILPCRHMCMCSECAKVLRMQSNKCPICRTSIESLLQIKISRQERTEEKKTPTLTKEETEAEPCAPPSPGASAPASSSGLSA